MHKGKKNPENKKTQKQKTNHNKTSSQNILKFPLEENTLLHKQLCKKKNKPKMKQKTPATNNTPHPPNNLVFEIQFILEYKLRAMEKNANQQRLNLLQALHLFRTHLLKQCLPKVIRITISCIRYLEARQNIPNTPNCHIYLFNPQCGPFTGCETQHGNKGRQESQEQKEWPQNTSRSAQGICKLSFVSKYSLSIKQMDICF